MVNIQRTLLTSGCIFIASSILSLYVNTVTNTTYDLIAQE